MQLRRLRGLLVLSALIQPILSAQTPAAAQADAERVRLLVEAGALPRAALLEARKNVEDARDDEILRQTLYGSLGVEQLTEPQTAEMIATAQRRLDRQRDKLERAQKLVDSGVAAKSSLDPLLQEEAARRLTVELAQGRAKIFREVAEMARAERNAELAAESPEPVDHRVAVRFEGQGVFDHDDYKKVVLAYEKEFGKPIPVSAMGETELHRALGFDHRGRIDVALTPDQPEGVWLRHYLEAHRLPYFAFRAALAGSATGAHIHLGPPSTRLASAD